MRAALLLALLLLACKPPKKCTTSADCDGGEKCYATQGGGMVPAGQYCALPALANGLPEVVASVEDFPRSCDMHPDCAQGRHSPAPEVDGPWSEWRPGCRIRAWTRKCPRCTSNYGDRWEDDPKGCSGLTDPE